MASGKVDFEGLAESLIRDENTRRNQILDHGWGLESAPQRRPQRCPQRRKSPWAAPLLIATILVIGVTSLGVAAFYRRRADARELPRQSPFATVTVGTGAVAPGEAATPIVPALAAGGQGKEQLPAATSPRRAPAPERQRSV